MLERRCQSGPEATQAKPKGLQTIVLLIFRKKTVSKVHNLPSNDPDSGPVHEDTVRDAILAYLKKISNIPKAFG